MTMTLNTVRTRIVSTARLANSQSGNPRYVVHTLAGSFRTALDSQAAFAVGSDSFANVGVDLFFNEDHRIIGMRTEDGTHEAGTVPQ
ncbi:hypothetical protein SEA_PUPPER_71 [Gordonia phage Pupper]|uniref:Uncharacterized protein n=1 Tax=Gordonia phage Pupper TaxID=2571249 RepID=A0A4Y6EKI7_9CAUD|nr:hypothetical protein KHQ83_gp206 [Gordonia phage Pupper]QDF18557.1 hypothetical protein SEA_PUPPER_71 [Gordonia phage Pupper]QDF18789.1 hypothetical protein SEA_SCENTAE_70 [Gordonia phage SCentae]